MHGVKKITEYVDARSHVLPGFNKDAPVEPSQSFGGGRRTASSFFTNKPLGPLPPLLLGGGAILRSRYLSKYRCDQCGKLQVVTATARLPVETDWVDDTELALAELMDENGRVPHREAADYLAPRAVPPRQQGQDMVGRGMLAQLFMLEVPEPSQEFTVSEVVGHASKKVDLKKWKRTRSSCLLHRVSGTADFTRLVMLMRLSVHPAASQTSWCKRPTRAAPAGMPDPVRAAQHGGRWDGGRAVVVPRSQWK